MLKLSPSILAADFSILGKQIEEVDAAGVPYLHIDVMDGTFVPSISFGMPLIESIRKVSSRIVFDVHLMIMEPERYLEEFKNCGADIITFHLEAAREPRRLIDKIHAMGLKAGISIKPETPVADVLPFAGQADMILVMSVNPGFGGQAFMPQTLNRVRELRDYLTRHHLEGDIQVDGGLYRDNLREIIQTGANVLVAGSAIFQGNITKNIKEFQNIFAEYENI